MQRLESRDQQIAMDAAQDLLDIGPSVVPVLVEELARFRGCQFQFVASGIVARLDPEHAIVTRTLINVVRGQCVVQASDDTIIRRQAGFVLAARADGIPTLATMLKDRDLFVSRTAAFGFYELAKNVNHVSDDARLMAAAIAALPALVEGLQHRDEMVRCLAFDTLDRFRGADSNELRTATVRLTDVVVAPRSCARPGEAPGWRKSEVSR
jgi:HEAT repeat protein